MTATTTSNGVSLQSRTSFGLLRRVARNAASLLAICASRWNDVVSTGQLGPSGDVVISRHIGGRI